MYTSANVNMSDQTLFCSQESAKVSDLNPNAKAWANHMFSLDPSGSADTTTAALQPWKEGCDSSVDPGPEGQPTIFDSWPLFDFLFSATLANGPTCKSDKPMLPPFLISFLTCEY